MLQRLINALTGRHRALERTRLACTRAQTLRQLAAVEFHARMRHGPDSPAARYALRYMVRAREAGVFGPDGARAPGRP